MIFTLVCLLLQAARFEIGQIILLALSNRLVRGMQIRAVGSTGNGVVEVVEAVEERVLAADAIKPVDPRGDDLERLCVQIRDRGGAVRLIDRFSESVLVYGLGALEIRDVGRCPA